MSKLSRVLNLFSHRGGTLGTLALFFVALLVTAQFITFAPLEQGEFYAKDLRIRYARQATRDTRLVYLAIDNLSVSLDQLGDETIAASPALTLMKKEGWPWPRSVHGLVLDRLIGAGAKVVFFDIMVPTSKPSDPLFHQALDRHVNQVVIGSNFVPAEDSTDQRTTLTVPASSVIPPQQPLDRRIGFVNFWPDPDGVIRHAQYRVTLEQTMGLIPFTNSEIFESLAARALRQAGLEHLIPSGLEAKGFRFVGPPGAFEPISLHEIFLPDQWNVTFRHGEFFRDKIILIGPHGNWLKDELETPFGMMPGPEIHLNALNAALHQDFLHDSPLALNLLVIVLAGLLTFSLSYFLRSPVHRLYAFLAVTVGYITLLVLLYNQAGYFLIALAPLATFNGSGFLSFVYEYVREQLEKARIRSTLDRYVSKTVASYILQHAGEYNQALGGVRKPCTILFSDIRGFTTMTENADEQQLVIQLNEYLTAMADCVLRHDGRLDKYIGDAVMATWGDIKSDGTTRDAIKAIHCALDMLTALLQLNAQWTAQGRQALQIGIGLNFGEVIFGNMGATQKMELTVIGDAVNLASRLEGQTKDYQQQLLLGESVAALVREAFTLQFVDAIRVKGKTRGVEIFRIDQPQPKPEDDYLRTYHAGVNLFCQRQFTEAKEKFRAAAALRPDDFLAPMWIKNSEELEKNPPGPDWDGIAIKTSK